MELYTAAEHGLALWDALVGSSYDVIERVSTSPLDRASSAGLPPNWVRLDRRTGDVASRDADGYLTYVGRADDVFKASDYRISPFELESALIEHEAIAEAAVVPSPDALRLAVPKAFLILTGDREPSRELALEIFQHIRTTLPPYKRIRRIEFADLPKTISGKIRRVELRRREQQADRGTELRGTLEFWEEDFAELRG